MADNYLEKRMADYQAGKLSTRHTVAAHRKSASAGAAIHVSRNAATVGLLTALRKTGVRVSFDSDDTQRGAAMAQASGTTFIPLDTPEAITRASSLRMTDEVWLADTPEPASLTLSLAGHIMHRIDATLSHDELAALIAVLAGIAAPLDIKRLPDII